MEIQKDSRQMPSVEKYTSDKDYNDLLYGYLQAISFSDMDEEGNVYRFLEKNQINFSGISRELNGVISRQLVAKKFQHLIDMGLIAPIEDGTGRYKLINLQSSLAALVPTKTLKFINNCLKARVASIYVLLLKRYYCSEQKPFQITLEQMQRFVGLKPKNGDNDDVIRDILDVLVLLGLIEKEKRYSSVDKKTRLYITKVTNIVKKVEDKIVI